MYMFMQLACTTCMQHYFLMSTEHVFDYDIITMIYSYLIVIVISVLTVGIFSRLIQLDFDIYQYNIYTNYKQNLFCLPITFRYINYCLLPTHLKGFLLINADRIKLFTYCIIHES